MRGRDAFTVWAPFGAEWTAWTRPVPFVEADQGAAYGLAQITLPDIYYLDAFDKGCAIFVDKPSYHAVEEGLALAKRGWRPIPLYNCSDAQAGVLSAVENNDIEAALLLGTDILTEIPLPLDAPPAFLLDANRLNRYKMHVSVFDNSWDIYAQDVPSAAYLISRGITNILLSAPTIGRDLRQILYTYQQKGIQILRTDGLSPALPIRLRRKPFNLIRSMLHT